ncbi:MAG: PVC-type heme-binding CxxCH protein [Akkermansiaceae bacterium]
MIAATGFAHAAQDHLVFEAKGKANGKHVVLLAGDEEYRSEESMPMLGQVLANNGFKCTVLFSMDKNNKFVDPNNQKSLSNPKALSSADAIIMAVRFRNWDEPTFDKFNAAFERGVPIVSLRTTTHAFKIDDKKAKYHKFNWRSKVKGWEGGFGRQVLGETWVNHHGAHAKQGTLTVTEKNNAKHPVLNGVGEIFGRTDVYGAAPLEPSTILLRGAVTDSLAPTSKPIAGDKNDPMMPVAWVRDFKQKNGKVNKVLTTTMGSADDLSDEDLRRLVVNGIYWGLGMDVPAKADVTPQSAYNPTFYGIKEIANDPRTTFRKNHTPEDFIILEAPKKAKAAKPAAAAKKDPKKDRANAKAKRRAKEAAELKIENEAKAAAIAAKLALLPPGPKHPDVTPGTPPASLEVVKDMHIGFIGGGLGSRMNIYNRFETELQRRYPENDLFIRNWCREGDTPAFRPHPSRKSHWVIPNGQELVKEEYRKGGGQGHYETPDQWLTHNRIDTIIGFFGYSESFDGYNRIDGYKAELRAFIKYTLSQKYSGNTPQLAIVSPAALEDLSAKKDLPNGKKTNARLQAYTNAMREVCKEEGVLFVDAFSITKGLYDSTEEDLTYNGSNLTDEAYKKFSPLLADTLFGNKEATGDEAKIHAAVAEKNFYWLHDYKIPNGVHVHGRRYKPFGSVNYPDEITKTRQMLDIRDQALWAANKGQDFDTAAADAKTIKLKPVTSNSDRPNVYISGKEMESKLTLPEGYKMELFADEDMFPDLANPSQMAFDNKGRLWVSCMPSYPQYQIGDPLPNDKILIFEDTDNDGKADKQTIFVDNIVTPMGFEITEHGVFVSLQNDLVLFKDNDGDDKADEKIIVLSGFDDHDTHHAISSFCADPSGAIYMGEGVFLHSNVETPYGPVRGTNGGFYRFNPNNNRLERTAQLGIPNPWGIAFDEWGQNFFIHTSGPSFSWMQNAAVKPRYGVNISAPDLLTKRGVRPTAGLEFISSRHFPDDVQGDALICNNIGFLGAMQNKMIPDGEVGYKAELRQKLFESSNPYFRPVDLEFAPDGSLYVVDWSNVLIGHMQHNARDPKRDHVHGRIYRITYPSRPLVPVAKVDGASIDELLENLKLPEIRTRYRTRRELRGRNHDEVAAALTKWVAGLDKADKNYDHNLTEAVWVSWGINQIDPTILEAALTAKDHRARAAATRAVRYNAKKLTNAVDLLKRSAADPHGEVRHEALIAASWMGKKAGLEIVEVFEKAPVNKTSTSALKYAKAHLGGEEAVAEVKEEVKIPAHLAKAPKKVQKSFQRGAEAYLEQENCTICHGPDGKGNKLALFPPLDGSKWVTKDKDLLIKIAIHGIMGEIEVNGDKYNSAMPGFNERIPNAEIADILTYVRNAWSNKAGDGVTKEEVDAIQKATDGQTQLGPYKAETLLQAHPIQ